jgi:hypothetical protein
LYLFRFWFVLVVLHFAFISLLTTQHTTNIHTPGEIRSLSPSKRARPLGSAGIRSSDGPVSSESLYRLNCPSPRIQGNWTWLCLRYVQNVTAHIGTPVLIDIKWERRSETRQRSIKKTQAPLIRCFIQPLASRWRIMMEHDVIEIMNVGTCNVRFNEPLTVLRSKQQLSVLKL